MAGGDSDQSDKTSPDKGRTPRASDNLAARGKSRSFAAVNQVLNRVMSGLNLERRLREHTLMAMWPNLIGEPFATLSRPLYIDADGNVVISVADASVGQELSLMKFQIVGQLKQAARAVGLDIKGLRLDLKHYHCASDIVQLTSEIPALPSASDADLENVTLSPADLRELENLHRQLWGEKANESADSGELRWRILKVFERELRLRRWQLNAGYPVCPGCGNPTPRLHSLKDMRNASNSGLCASCFFCRA